MNKSEKARLKELKRRAGRQDWHGIKPVTRVIPNKKKPRPDRKAKHKGRLHEPALSFWVRVSLPMPLRKGLARARTVEERLRRGTTRGQGLASLDRGFQVIARADAHQLSKRITESTQALVAHFKCGLGDRGA